MNKYISISILDSNPLNLEDCITELINLEIKHIHLDIGDTSFIPNIILGFDALKCILKHDFIFDIHFMIEEPLILIEKLLEFKNCTFIIHYEIKQFEKTLNFLIEHKNKYGFNIGVAIKPSTHIEYINPNVDKLLIMTVEPGFGGQKLMIECINKIEIIKKIFKGQIGIDGGVNLDNIANLRSADFVVVGSYFSKSHFKAKTLDDLKKLFF